MKILKNFYSLYRFKTEVAEIQAFLEAELKKRTDKIIEMENEMKNQTISSEALQNQVHSLLEQIENNKVNLFGIKN
jgi:hypothetical protein